MFANNVGIGGNLTASVVAQGGIKTTVLPVPTGLAVGVGSGNSNLPQVTYYYRISAYNDWGETLASTEVSYFPPQPTAVNANGVTWNPVVGATGYKLYARCDPAQSGRTTTHQLLATLVGGLNASYNDIDISVVTTDFVPDIDTTGGIRTPNGALAGTLSPISWNVTTAGNDTTGNGSVGKPFATPAGALARLISVFGYDIHHLVEINIGVGSFPGFTIQNFNCDALIPDGGVASGLIIRGTYVTATVATGTATGTFTATANGAAGGLATADDSTQTWTVDDLKGKVCEITSGTGIGTSLNIVSNTATQLVFATTGTTIGVAGSGYTIRDWGTVLDTQVTVASRPTAIGTTASSAITTNLLFANNESGQIEQYVMERIKISHTVVGTTAVILRGEAGLRFNQCHFIQPSAIANALVNDSCTNGGRFINCLFSRTNVSSGAAITLNRVNFCSITNSGFLLNTSGVGISLIGSEGSTISGNYIENSGVGIALTVGSSVSNYGGRISGGATGVFVGATSGTTTVSPAHIFFLGLSVIENCTIAAVSAIGPNSAVIVGGATMAGTGNLVGIATSQGAVVKVLPTTTITGTSELTLDGVADTLANLRAQTPKVLVNAYGSRFYEV